MRITKTSRATAAIMAYSLTGVRTLDQQHVFISVELHFMCHRDGTPVAKHNGVWTTSSGSKTSEFPSISTSRTIQGTGGSGVKGKGHFAVLIFYIFHDHSTATAACCALLVSITPHNVL